MLSNKSRNRFNYVLRHSLIQVANGIEILGLLIWVFGLIAFGHSLIFTPLNPFTDTLGQWGNDWFFFFNDLPIYVPLLGAPALVFPYRYVARIAVKIHVEPDTPK